MLMLLLVRLSCERQARTMALHWRPCTSVHTLDLLIAPFCAASIDDQNPLPCSCCIGTRSNSLQE